MKTNISIMNKTFKGHSGDIADALNELDTIRFKLIFMEAALRGMTELGITEEKGISEGISCMFNSIILEYQTAIKQVQNITATLNPIVENEKQ